MKRLLVAAAAVVTLGLTPVISFVQSAVIGGRVGEMTMRPGDVGLFKKPSYSPYKNSPMPLPKAKSQFVVRAGAHSLWSPSRDGYKQSARAQTGVF